MKKLQKFTPKKNQLVKNAEKLNGKRDMRKKVVKSTSVGSDLKKRIVKRQQGGTLSASYINVEEPVLQYDNNGWIPVEDVFSDYNLPTQLNKTKEEPLPEAVKGTKEEISKDELEKRPIKQNAFINGLRPIISDTLKNRGIDTKWTDYLVAQAALESGWGKSESGKFNLSGIKGKGTTRSTKEYINGKMVNTKDSFKDYKNYEDWANQYINLLTNKRYGKAFSMSEQEFMPYIVKQGYATDPNYISKYNKVLNEVKKYQEGGTITGKQKRTINRMYRKNRNVPFINRIMSKSTLQIPDWEGVGNYATHKLGWAENDKGAFIFPNVQQVGNDLRDYTFIPDKWAGADAAQNKGNVILTTPENAKLFTEHYKDSKYFKRYAKNMPKRFQLGGTMNGLSPISFFSWFKSKPTTKEPLSVPETKPHKIVGKDQVLTPNFLNFMWSLENSVKNGYKNGKWYAHSSAEGGGKTVGPGIKINSKTHPLYDKVITKKQGLTTEEANKYLLELSGRSFDKVGKYITNKYDQVAWDTISPNIKQLLIRKDYNSRNGIKAFPKLVDAAVKGDIEGMRKHSKGYYKDPKTKKYVELPENKRIWDLIYYKKDGGKIQRFGEGKPIKEHPETKDVYEFYSKWLSNPEYAKRIDKYGFYKSKGKDVAKFRQRALDNTTVEKSFLVNNYYKNDKIVLPTIFNLRADNVPAHEVGHVLGSYNPTSSIAKAARLSDKEVKYIISQMKGYDPDYITKKETDEQLGYYGGHDQTRYDKAVKLEKLYKNPSLMEEDSYYFNSPSEAKANLQAFRYWLYKNGIYDINSGKPFTKDVLNKAKQKGGLDASSKRLLETFEDDKLINLMNTLASNTQTTNNVHYVKLGNKLTTETLI